MISPAGSGICIERGLSVTLAGVQAATMVVMAAAAARRKQAVISATTGPSAGGAIRKGRFSAD